MKIWKRLSALVLAGAMCLSFAGAANFSDVSPNAWYYEAVQACSNIGYLNGYPDGTFHPKDALTRAECAQILENINPIGYAEVPYVDVSSSAWYWDVVCHYGWFLGGSYEDPYHSNLLGPLRYFYPEQQCTREDFAVGLYHILGYDSGGWKYHFNDLADFSEGNDWDNYRQAACAMANNGLMVGDGNGNFNPKRSITRAEVAQVVYNYISNAEG